MPSRRRDLVAVLLAVALGVAVAVVAGRLNGDGRSGPAAARAAEAAPALSGLRRVACPAGGTTGGAYARPRLPRPGEVADMEPSPGLRGFRIVRGANLLLPSGRLFQSGGDVSTEEVPGQALGAGRGPHPWFLVLARFGGGVERPAFAQFVLDPRHPPVRWVEDDRFGFGTDGGVGVIGSPEAARLAEAEGDAYFDTWIAWGDEGSPCLALRGRRAETLVLYDNGYGDGWFPAAAGLDGRGRLVAITWFLRSQPWVLGGFPGLAPAAVRRITACRAARIARGGDRRQADADCA